MKPVSDFLRAELLQAVRRHGVVMWLDADGSYTDFVDTLATDVPFAVYAFRGSHLALMLELEATAGGIEPTPLLVHLPGFHEDSVRDTPLLELYAAGARFRRKLDTLVSDAAAGRVPAEVTAAFVQAGVPSLAAADAWLAARLGQGGSALPDDLRLAALVDDLLAADGQLGRRLLAPELTEALWGHLHARIGLGPAWRAQALPAGALQPGDLAFAITSQALAVEYADDLRRPPVAALLAGMQELPRPVIDACRDLAAHLRRVHPAFYQRTADETEGWLEDEARAARASDLGRIDTFRFEEERVLDGALAALGEEKWALARAWAEPRAEGGSFWVGQEVARRSAWQLVLDAVRLGEALVAAGTALEATSLPAAVERYTGVGAAVDRAHRHLEQRRSMLLHSQLPRAERLREALDVLRSCWRIWADDWSRDFNQLCRREGFLPPSELQQRTLFEQVVWPETRQGPTALLLVDAMRFEMAEELLRVIEQTPATTAALRPRLAELPTVTEVGMNALAPVARNGRLAVEVREGKVAGFTTGEFRVSSPDSRQRAMADRVGGPCPWLGLGEVLERDGLRQTIARARLVVVVSDEIDAAGESGVGAAVFDLAMQRLRAAWTRLREAGIRRFVVTADHGFLLLDEPTLLPHGRRIDPQRRYILSTVAADHTHEARVALGDLDYDGAAGLHLMMPAHTAVFDRGDRASGFVHGGNSLQERVIPVLTVTHRAAIGGDTLRYEVVAAATPGVAGLSCLEGQVEVVADGQLTFGGTREVELGLRVTDDAHISVELCQVRGGARLDGATLVARVGERFELFFRLTGPHDLRVQVELYHPSGAADVTGAVITSRFPVTATTRHPEPAAPSTSWLDGYEPGERQLFAHLAAHGSVTEPEAITMLGGPRAMRRFSARFEELAARAPFAVRIDSIGGVKRYVKEGAPR